MGRFAFLPFKHIRKYSKMASSLEEIVQHLNNFADLSMAEPWDNVGLLVEPSEKRPIDNILLTNDLSETVLEQAITEDIPLIISYHPPIFQPLKRLTQNSWKERIITKCIENKIAVYSPHTAWDNKDDGIADWLISSLWPYPFKNRTPIQKRENITVENYFGSGRLITGGSVELSKIVQDIRNLIGLNSFQVAFWNREENITSVAAVPGSGASLLKGVKADLYITGEISHHEVLDAVHNGTSVIMTNHSNSERGYLKVFKRYFEDKTGVTCILATRDRDPLEIY